MSEVCESVGIFTQCNRAGGRAIGFILESHQCRAASVRSENDAEAAGVLHASTVADSLEVNIGSENSEREICRIGAAKHGVIDRDHALEGIRRGRPCSGAKENEWEKQENFLGASYTIGRREGL